jgi:hypothetical protein
MWVGINTILKEVLLVTGAIITQRVHPGLDQRYLPLLIIVVSFLCRPGLLQLVSEVADLILKLNDLAEIDLNLGRITNSS